MKLNIELWFGLFQKSVSVRNLYYFFRDRITLRFINRHSLEVNKFAFILLLEIKPVPFSRIMVLLNAPEYFIQFSC